MAHLTEFEVSKPCTVTKPLEDKRGVATKLNGKSLSHKRGVATKLNGNSLSHCFVRTQYRFRM